ncbi:MAG TPA: hypothetical protein VMV77_14025 [Bacteroidales bacterium]|nr:hypothetical protein [Bacteroidales bacterium]
MKSIKRIFIVTFLPVLCLLCLSIDDSAAQVKKMSAKDLTEVSTAVLYGKCSKLKSEWNENKSIIYTYVTIVPEEYIKGNLGSEAVIAVPGGRVGDIIYEVSEMPVFMEGEEVVAFIWTNPAGKNLVTGGYQGKMKIEKDKDSGKRMVVGAGLDEEDETGELGTGKPDKGKKVSLEDFTAKVKGYMKH